MELAARLVAVFRPPTTVPIALWISVTFSLIPSTDFERPWLSALVAEFTPPTTVPTAVFAAVTSSVNVRVVV
jgi:hypothetical protein